MEKEKVASNDDDLSDSDGSQEEQPAAVEMKLQKPAGQQKKAQQKPKPQHDLRGKQRQASLPQQQPQSSESEEGESDEVEGDEPQGGQDDVSEEEQGDN